MTFFVAFIATSNSTSRFISRVHREEHARQCRTPHLSRILRSDGFRVAASPARQSGIAWRIAFTPAGRDPEGLALAKDAIRSLRDLWEIPIDYHRVGVTKEQIEKQGLFEDYSENRLQQLASIRR